MEDVRRVADYFVIAGLPEKQEELQLLDEYSLEVNLKPSAYQVREHGHTSEVAFFMLHPSTVHF